MKKLSKNREIFKQNTAEESHYKYGVFSTKITEHHKSMYDLFNSQAQLAIPLNKKWYNSWLDQLYWFAIPIKMKYKFL